MARWRARCAVASRARGPCSAAAGADACTSPAGSRSRPETAATWLRERDATVAELAHSLGYRSEAAFSRAFKRAPERGRPVARVSGASAIFSWESRWLPSNQAGGWGRVCQPARRALSHEPKDSVPTQAKPLKKSSRKGSEPHMWRSKASTKAQTNQAAKTSSMPGRPRRSAR